MSNRRVLITGATGFIGARVVRQVVERGWEPIALLPPDDQGGTLDGCDVHVIRGTLADIDGWDAEAARLAPDACLHLAWTTAPGVYLDTPDNLNWLSWSGQLLSRLPKWGVRRVVVAGTCAEYDSDYGYLRETSPTRPLTLYAASKLSLRLVAEQLAARSGLQFSWARIFHLYGPGEHPRRLVASCIRTLLAGERFEATEGRQIRDFLHVDDVASGLLAVLDADGQGDVNVCSGEPVAVRQLLESVGHVVGRSDLLALGARPAAGWDPPFLCGDNGRLRTYGWRPKFSLTTGIADAVEWWRSRL